MASYAREPRAYELMVILLPELADDDLTGAIERVSGYITDVTGTIKEVLTDSPWGRRRLAYTIRFNSQDYRDGFYAIWHFDLEPSQMGDIERELKLDTRVIRYLVVHDDPKWGSPNEGNQPPAGENESDSGRPGRTRPSGPTRPAAERAASPNEVAQTADESVATPAGETAAPTADVAATASDVTGTPGEVIETAPAPEETAVAAETEGAGVDAPASETADAAPVEAPVSETTDTAAVEAPALETADAAAVEAPVSETAGTNETTADEADEKES